MHSETHDRGSTAMLNYREKEEEEEGQVEEHKIETLGSLEKSAGLLRGIARSAG